MLFNNAAVAYFNWLEDITNEEWNRDLRGVIDRFVSHPRGVAVSQGQPRALPTSRCRQAICNGRFWTEAACSA